MAKKNLRTIKASTSIIESGKDKGKIRTVLQDGSGFYVNDVLKPFCTMRTMMVFNSGTQEAYIKFPDGHIQTVRSFQTAAGNIYYAQLNRIVPNAITFQWKSNYQGSDIDQHNQELLEKTSPALRSLPLNAISQKFQERVKFRAVGRMGADPTANLVSNNSRIAEQVLSNDPVELYSSIHVPCTEFSEDQSPIYMEDYDVLLAYGSSGYRLLKNTKHPKQSEYRASVVQAYIDGNNEGATKSNLIKYLKEGHLLVNDEELINYHYSTSSKDILIVDNEGLIGDLWYVDEDRVVCAESRKFPGFQDGIYVITRHVDPSDPKRNVANTKRYMSIAEVENYILYSSLKAAENSDSYQANIEREQRIKDRDAKYERDMFKLKTDMDNLREASALAADKHQRDIESMNAKSKVAADELAQTKEKAEMARTEYERNMAARDLRLQDELEKHSREHAAWQEKRDADQEKFVREQERIRQEHTAWQERCHADAIRAERDREETERKRADDENKYQRDKTMGMIKFLSDAAKATVIIVPIAVAGWKFISSRLKARALATAAAAAA